MPQPNQSILALFENGHTFTYLLEGLDMTDRLTRHEAWDKASMAAVKKSIELGTTLVSLTYIRHAE